MNETINPYLTKTTKNPATEIYSNNELFLYPLKTSKSQWISDVFRGKGLQLIRYANNYSSRIMVTSPKFVLQVFAKIL